MIYESQYYGIVNTGPELMHHGIKGQRWGVRRFQYEDGSYTQAGLARYNKSESEYKQSKGNLKSAVKAYRSGTGSEGSVQNARAKYDKSKAELKRAKRQLKEDVTRDKGRALYRKGKTIEGVEKRKIAAGAIGGAAMIGSIYAFSRYGEPFVNSLMYRKNLRGTPVKSIAAATALAGSTAATYILMGKYESDEAKMRTYWHNRGKQG